MSTVREGREQVLATLRRELDSKAAASRFPLDGAVQTIQRGQSQGVSAQPQEFLAPLLDLFEVTSVSAALAIKRLGSTTSDASGIRDALVDLWGRAEAARSLLFDVLTVWAGDERDERITDLWETARLLAPDAIAMAMRLSEPVSQYVEFASKVIGQGGGASGSISLEIPRS
jgi:hypothetical protein